MDQGLFLCRNVLSDWRMRYLLIPGGIFSHLGCVYRFLLASSRARAQTETPDRVSCEPVLRAGDFFRYYYCSA